MEINSGRREISNCVHEIYGIHFHLINSHFMACYLCVTRLTATDGVEFHLGRERLYVALFLGNVCAVVVGDSTSLVFPSLATSLSFTLMVLVVSCTE